MAIAQEDDIVSAESVEGSACRNEANALLLSALAELTDIERELIAMKFTLDMTNRDIAAGTGLGESNVGVILFRAMRKLREILGPENI